MLKSTKLLVEKVGDSIGLSRSEVDLLLKLDQEHVFEILLDDGSTYKAYRMQHKNTLGPYKGGIRFHPGVDENEVKALSILMSLKTAAVGLPLGGGKGGIAVDPRQLSDKQLEQLARAYVRHLHEHIGPDKDIPAPDVNTNSKVIDWMADEFEQITGDLTKAAFTGKSVSRGGIEGREEATGRGGVLALKTVLESENMLGKKLTYGVQGFGNVGLHFCEQARQILPEIRLLAATDSSGGVFSTTGLDVEKVAKYKVSGNKLAAYKAENTGFITNDQLMGAEVDILVLAALGGAVNKSNATDVRAKYVLELANGPVTEDVEHILYENGVQIIPDILANAGGVIVSYFEWLQNRSGDTWGKPRVNQELEKYIVTAVKDSLVTAADKKMNIREAALANAMTKLAQR
jgi:glutamate dehydrogenase (NADP+)